MKEILENEFGKAFGSTKIVEAKETVFCGTTRIKDDKSCLSCQKNDECKDQTVIEILSKTDIHIIDFESFVNNFPKITGSRCDLILYDKSKIALMELSCLSEEYLFNGKYGSEKTGKAVHAYKQISESLKKLHHSPSISKKINTFQYKTGIFAYRVKDLNMHDDFYKKFSDNTKQFSLFDKEMDKELMSSDIGYGFTFQKNRYPEKYIW